MLFRCSDGSYNLDENNYSIKDKFYGKILPFREIKHNVYWPNSERWNLSFGYSMFSIHNLHFFNIKIALYSKNFILHVPFSLTYNHTSYKRIKIPERLFKDTWEPFFYPKFSLTTHLGEGLILLMANFITLSGYYASDFWYEYNFARIYHGLNNVPNIGDVFMCNNFNPNQVMENFSTGFFVKIYDIFICIAGCMFYPNDHNIRKGLKLNIDYAPLIADHILKQHVRIYSCFILTEKKHFFFRISFIINYLGYISFYRKMKNLANIHRSYFRHCCDIYLNICLFLKYIEKYHTILDYVRFFIYFKSIFGHFRTYIAVVLCLYSFCLQIQFAKGLFYIYFFTDNKFVFPIDSFFDKNDQIISA